MFNTLYLLDSRHHLRAVIKAREELVKHNEPTRASRWLYLGPGVWAYFLDGKSMLIGTQEGLTQLGVDMAAKLKRRQA